MTGRASMQVLAVHSGGQNFGIGVTRVVHVLRAMKISPVPGAPATIAGLINLRGHTLVTLDLRGILDQPERPADIPPVGVILETSGEPVCLLVDTVGDVIDLIADDYFEPPGHIPDNWTALTEGIYRQPDDLLIKLNEDALLSPERVAA